MIRYCPKYSSKMSPFATSFPTLSQRFLPGNFLWGKVRMEWVTKLLSDITVLLQYSSYLSLFHAPFPTLFAILAILLYFGTICYIICYILYIIFHDICFFFYIFCIKGRCDVAAFSSVWFSTQWPWLMAFHLWCPHYWQGEYISSWSP